MSAWAAELEAHKAATRAWLKSEIDFLATKRRLLTTFADLFESTSSGAVIDIHAAIACANITAADVAEQARAVDLRSKNTLHGGRELWLRKSGIERRKC